MNKSSPASEPRVLLLDLDGTVLDTHELIYDCFRHTLHTHLGCEPSRPHWEAGVGLPLDEMFVQALRALGREEHSVPALVEAYRARMAGMSGGALPFPGIPEALESLTARGIRLAIVTTKHARLALPHLEGSGLARLFSAVVTGDQCRHCKPHPEPFLRGLQALGALPGEAAGVGDSRYDIESARAAGVLTVAACWVTTHREALLAAGPDRVLHAPQELTGLVE